MAITSEIIGKLGGSDVRTVNVNTSIREGKGFVNLYTFTIDNRSLVSATLTHDNTDAFGHTSGRGVISLVSPSDTVYGTNYTVKSAEGDPLCANVITNPGELTVYAASLSSSYNYTAKNLTIVVAPL